MVDQGNGRVAPNVYSPARRTVASAKTRARRLIVLTGLSCALGVLIATAVEIVAVTQLPGRTLAVPVKGVDRSDLQDSFADSRGTGPHEAIDIPAPRGTPVVAVEDGRIAKLFSSKPGGLTIYLFDPTETFCYYYAHLDGYAAGLREGQAVKKGEVIGYVGTTGNAPPDTPHLHFAVFRLTPERQWWKGEAINPYPLLK